MEDSHFDVLIVGTGLTESISAAALSKAGFKVAHVDANQYYGGNETSLTHEEFFSWLQAQSDGGSQKFTSISWAGETLLNQSRQYAICLRPSIIPSIGPVISSLISSGVSKYGGFRLVEHVGIYHESRTVKNVPGTKEDVFKTKEISLIDKRRLMRFLMFAVGDFEEDTKYVEAADTPFAEYLKSQYSLSGDIASAIVYALSFSQSQAEPTKKVLPRLKKYLRSAGRYGATPFLLGHYGGTGEVAQGFCRAGAVSGGVYILGRNIESITLGNAQDPTSNVQPRYEIVLNDFPEKLTANVVICSASQAVLHHLPPGIQPSPVPSSEYDRIPVARCIAIIDKPIRIPTSNSPSEEEDGAEVTEEALSNSQKALDAGVIVFPPSTVPESSSPNVATLLVTGEGSMSTPAGKWILYLTIPVDEATTNTRTAQDILKPYLDAAMALTLSPEVSSEPPAQSTSLPPQPLFSAYYFEHPDPAGAFEDSSQAAPEQASSFGSSKSFIISPGLSPSTPLPEAPDVAAVNAEKVFWEVVNVLKEMETREGGDGSAVASSVEGFWPPVDPGDGSDGEDGW